MVCPFLFEKSYQVTPLMKIHISEHHEATDQINKILIDLQELPDLNKQMRKMGKVTLKVNKRNLKIANFHKFSLNQIVCCAVSLDNFAFVSRLNGRLTCFVLVSAHHAAEIQDTIQKLDPGLGPELGGFSREELFGESANCVREITASHEKSS